MLAQDAHPDVPGRMDSPVAARSRELFASVAAMGNCPMPSASILADRIEERLWRDRPHAFPSTEAELSLNFAVGRRLVRQASRILQQRGVMTARRGGGGSGGLRPTIPNTSQAADALADAVRDESSARAIHDARALLLPCLSTVDGPLSSFVRQTIESIEAGPSRSGAPEERCSQAWQLAMALLRQLAAKGTGGTRVFLGSLDAIAQQHDASLEIAVEAVRLLEDRQVVELRRGRGGGVYGSSGSVTQAARMANAFLAGHQVSVEACSRILGAINVRMTDLACERASDEGRGRVQAALSKMRNARNSTELGVAWYPLQREVAELADSPVLHIFARSLAGSLLLRRLRSAELPHAAASELFDASQRIASNVLTGTLADNSDAHWRCQRALEPHW